MKFLNLTLVLSLWATLLIAQNSVEWEALPQQRGSNAKLVYQASYGNLLAKVDANDQYIFSNDDGQTWHDVKVPSTPSYFYFYYTSDDEGNLLSFAKNKIYKLDTTDYEFKTLLTFESNAWVFDIKYKGGKMYILTEYGLKIYDAKSLTLLSNNINMLKCGKLLLSKNQNYALKYLTPDFEYEVYTFNETDFKLTLQSIVPSGTSILNSGKLVYVKNDSIITSSDFGKTWQPLLPYRNASFFYVNRQKEMIINNQGIFQMSADDGQTWEDLSSPKDKSLDVFWLENPKKQLIFEHPDCLNTELYLSKDMGKHWDYRSFRVGRPSSIALKITPDDEILTQNCYLFEQIKDKGNWEDINQSDSIYLSYSNQFTIFPSGKWLEQDIYGRIYTSIDKGKTWKKIIIPILNSNWSVPNFVINQNMELLYFNHEKTYLSKDEGLTWNELDYSYNNKDFYLENLKGITLKQYQYLIVKEYSTTGLNSIILFDSKNKIAKYIDKVNGKIISYTSNLLALDNEKFGFIDFLNAGQPIYLHISSDFGTTFKTKKITIGKDAAFSNIIKGPDNSIILITTKDVLISYDEGDSWVSIKSNLPTDAVYYTDAVLDKEKHLYLGSRGASIYKTKKPLSKVIATTEKAERELEIQIFPNPTDNFINIQVSDNELLNSKIEVLNIEGKVLKNVVTDEKNTTFDISFLPKGVYILKVTNVNKCQTKRFVKQ